MALGLRVALLFIAMTTCQAGGGNPVEIGKVHWSRDLEAGLVASKKSGKPVFLLFQEVPG